MDSIANIYHRMDDGSNPDQKGVENELIKPDPKGYKVGFAR
jgi:hypothetical protein